MKVENFEALMSLLHIPAKTLLLYYHKIVTVFFSLPKFAFVTFLRLLCDIMSFAPILLPGPPSPFFLLLQPPTFRLLYLSPNLLEYVTQLGFVDWKEKTLGNLLHPNDLAQTMNDSLAFLKNGTVNGCTTKCLLNWTPVR